MAVVKFNKDYQDKELNKRIKAGEEIEMTVKRADEVVKNIKKQTDRFKDYKDFAYERVEE